MPGIDRIHIGSFWKRKGHPDVATAGPPVQPNAPTNLSSSAITDTSVTLTWTLSTSPGITEQRIYLNSSKYATISDGTSTSTTLTGLTPGTTYNWRITAYNGTTALNSPFSTQYSMTTTQTVVNQAPNAPRSVTAVKNPSSPSDSINVTWVAPLTDGTHSAQTGYRVYADGVQNGADLGASATSYTITGQTPGDIVTVTVKAFNAAGASVASSGIDVTLDSAASTITTLMGTSYHTTYNHGNKTNWDVWRVYNRFAMLETANGTMGSQTISRPKALAYSESGPNLGGTSPNYTTNYNHVLSELNNFYYTSSTGQTHSSRWGIKLYWSNGNEMYDKGILANQTSANITSFINNSQKALYDAVHYIDPTTGQRRFPDAYAGSNPTTEAEKSGLVQPWLHPSAQYHDFVMWSMYMPNMRSATEAVDPSWDWPTFSESQMTNANTGFLIRCYYRTKQAMLQARNDTGNPNFQLLCGVGECGPPDDPQDQNTRPYYAAYGMAEPMNRLSITYGTPNAFLCWWDGWVDESVTKPDTRLQNEPVGTSPSTSDVWQNWKAYHTSFGGTKPASWAGKPGNIRKYYGTPLS